MLLEHLHSSSDFWGHKMRTRIKDMWLKIIFTFSGIVGIIILIALSFWTWPLVFIVIALLLLSYGMIWIPVLILTIVDMWIDNRNEIKKLRQIKNKTSQDYWQIFNAQDQSLPVDAREAMAVGLIARNHREEKLQELLRQKDSASYVLNEKKIVIKTIDKQLKDLGYGALMEEKEDEPNKASKK